MLHMVIQFWKIGDFLFFSSSWQVLEESAILCGFRFIPAIFQQHTSQLLHLEKKLETGLYCELVSKELKDSYVEYVLLYDTIANRITINEVQAEHGSLRLMKNVWS